MTIVVLILHILVCLFLIGIVLLQSGKGAELGAAFGGSSQTIFGSRGAATFMNKMTTGVAVFFMVTSLLLAVLTTRGASIVKQEAPVKEETTIPATSGPVQEQEKGPIKIETQKQQTKPQPKQQAPVVPTPKK